MRLRQALYEDLSFASTEPSSPAAQQAAKMGLQYVGFGRYTDPKSGQVTHIVQDERLVPFKRAVRTNTFKNDSSDDYGLLSAIYQPQTDELNNALKSSFPPNKYSDQELKSLYQFTNGRYAEINNRLCNLPSGVSAKEIEPTTPDDDLPDLIVDLDNIMKKSRAPGDFIAYCRLSSDIDPYSIQPGSKFSFKGFRSITTSLNNTVNDQDAAVQTSPAGREMIPIMQIRVRKNNRGIYASDYSPNADENEFILPRGTQIHIHDGPKTLVGSSAQRQIMSQEVAYFDCTIKN